MDCSYVDVVEAAVDGQLNRKEFESDMLNLLVEVMGPSVKRVCSIDLEQRDDSRQRCLAAEPSVVSLCERDNQVHMDDLKASQIHEIALEQYS